MYPARAGMNREITADAVASVQKRPIPRCQERWDGPFGCAPLNPTYRCPLLILVKVREVRSLVKFHPWYLLEVPVEGEKGKVVLDGDCGDENVGMGDRQALLSE